jgi:uncharacterized protein
LYAVEGKQIFSRSIRHRARALGNLVDQKYTSDNLERILKEYFGNTCLSEALTEIIIPTYEIEQRIPWFFRSRHARDPSKQGYDFPMWMVARAASAAPTYFEPARINSENSQGYYALMDGGLYANHPGMCAYVEARLTHPDDSILIVSIGTGELTRRLPYRKVKGWGVARWAQPILNVVFDGVSKTINYQLEDLLPSDNVQHYYRLQTELARAKDDLDDTSSDNIQALMVEARELVHRNRATLDSLCAQLVDDAYSTD